MRSECIRLPCGFRGTRNLPAGTPALHEARHRTVPAEARDYFPTAATFVSGIGVKYSM